MSKDGTNSGGNGGLGSAVGGLVGLLGAVVLGRRKRHTQQQQDSDDDNDEPYSPIRIKVYGLRRKENDSPASTGRTSYVLNRL